MDEHRIHKDGKSFGTPGTLSEKLKTISHVLNKDPRKLTAKEAVDKGFTIRSTTNSHDPMYPHSQKNKGGKS